MDLETKSALAAQYAKVRPYWERFTKPLTVVFPAANTDCDVAHDLGVAPDGYHVVEADNVVYRRPGPWTETGRVFLRSPNAGTRATVILFTVREGT